MTQELRLYETGTRQHNLYKEMYKTQTYQHVMNKLKQYYFLNNAKLTMIEALCMLDDYIDPSDPDLDLPNSIHAYQTAERVRKEHPKNVEYQVAGLIHDVGKILFKYGEPSYNVVGDTYVVGAKFPETMVYYTTLKDNNPDYYDKRYNTKLGVYKENCGLDKLKLSFGHDEYLYHVLTRNTNHLFPYKLSRVIRYHSFYPWHSFNEYQHFMKNEDYNLLKDVQNFNKYDLYSKEDTSFKLTEGIKKYYEKLLQHFFPEPLQW